MAKRILILGGGAGGLLVAEQLWKKLKPGEAEVTIIDRNEKHVFLAGLPWVATGYRDLDDVTADLKVLETKRGLKVVNAIVTKIDVRNRVVVTDKGKFEYDYLVVALGVTPDYTAIPGLAETLAPWTPDRALKLREALAKVPKKVRIITGFVKPPYPCPPAPYEVATQLVSSLRNRGREVEAKVIVPDSKPLYTMGPAVSDRLMEILEELGVEFHGKAKYDHIDTKNKTIVLSDGERIPYDIMAVTPPFKPAKPVEESDLAGEGGWMRVDPLKGFRSVKYDDVYGIGDVIQPPLGLPMAGVVAHSEAEPLASAIIADIRGTSLTVGTKIYAACAMDLGTTGILPFCNFTPSFTGRGTVYCGRVFEGAIVKLFKEVFEAYWFTQVIPRD